MTDHIKKVNEKSSNLKPSLGDKVKGLAAGAFTFATLTAVGIITSVAATAFFGEAPSTIAIGMTMGLFAYSSNLVGEATTNRSVLRNRRLNNS